MLSSIGRFESFWTLKRIFTPIPDLQIARIVGFQICGFLSVVKFQSRTLRLIVSFSSRYQLYQTYQSCMKFFQNDSDAIADRLRRFLVLVYSLRLPALYYTTPTQLFIHAIHNLGSVFQLHAGLQKSVQVYSCSLEPNMIQVGR